MGPEAGVLLQSLIIRETPAKKDQDHLEVFTFTNPHVPDRTTSLRKDEGVSYLNAVTESLRILDSVGVDVLVMACNTAHARFAEIQASVETPLLNIVELAKQEIRDTEGRVGILATNGTIRGGLFGMPDRNPRILVPPPDLQDEVMTIIHVIKQGDPQHQVLPRLEKVVQQMLESGSQKTVLGCTELSIYHDPLANRFGPIFIDPMRLAAQRLVQMSAGVQCTVSG